MLENLTIMQPRLTNKNSKRSVRKHQRRLFRGYRFHSSFWNLLHTKRGSRQTWGGTGVGTCRRTRCVSITSHPRKVSRTRGRSSWIALPWEIAPDFSCLWWRRWMGSVGTLSSGSSPKCCRTLGWTRTCRESIGSLNPGGDSHTWPDGDARRNFQGLKLRIR